MPEKSIFTSCGYKYCMINIEAMNELKAEPMEYAVVDYIRLC